MGLAEGAEAAAGGHDATDPPLGARKVDEDGAVVLAVVVGAVLVRVGLQGSRSYEWKQGGDGWIPPTTCP